VSDIASSFRHTVGALKPALVNCLDFMNALPFFRAYKSHSWDALQITSDKKILDVACGVGFDVVEMAKKFPCAHFSGVDISEGFLQVARDRASGLRNADFFQGDAASLPFPNHCFDGVRIDRSLQHIKQPLAVIEEMVRVTRSKGRIVVSEPDWGTFIVYDGEVDIGAQGSRLLHRLEQLL
jgi:ubiquinone/menaquinone biosynthesis C-methylase UbiE